jgi:hypothetical protein
MIEQGKPAKHVAYAFGSLFNFIKARAVKRDAVAVKYILVAEFRELEAGAYNSLEVRVQAPEGTDVAVQALFNEFRDATYLFKEKVGMEWDHLLPGLQIAAVIHQIKDRGKADTIAALRMRIGRLESRIGDTRPQQFPEPYMSPTVITNMAKYNDAILDMADTYVRDEICSPSLTANALTLLVLTLTLTHFDQIRLMGLLASSCNDIITGKYG